MKPEEEFKLFMAIVAALTFCLSACLYFVGDEIGAALFMLASLFCMSCCGRNNNETI